MLCYVGYCGLLCLNWLDGLFDYVLLTIGLVFAFVLMPLLRTGCGCCIAAVTLLRMMFTCLVIGGLGCCLL